MNLCELSTLISRHVHINIYGETREYQQDLERCSGPVADIYASWWLYGEVLNGGLHQFYSNSTGIVAPEALLALRRVGMSESAKLLEKSIQFFRGEDIRDRAIRNQLLERYADEHQDPQDEGGDAEDAWDPFGAYSDKLCDSLSTEQGGLSVCMGKHALENQPLFEPSLQLEIRYRWVALPCGDFCPSECQEFIRTQRADTESSREAELNALFFAAEAADTERVAQLLVRGAQVDKPNWTGTTALMAAVACESSDTVELLLKGGADPNTQGPHQSTALMQAAETGHAEIAQLLLKAGAALDLRDASNRTPLMRAVENGDTDLMWLLIEGGADKSVKTVDGQDLKELAVEPGRNLVLRVLDGNPVALRHVPAEVRKQAEEAEGRYAAGDHKAALESFLKIPEGMRSRVFSVMSNMAYCYQQLGDQTQALVHFEAALELEPSRHHLWKSICYTYYEQKRWRDMLRCARNAVELEPEDSYSWQQMAIACTELDDAPGAIEANRRAVVLDPNNGYAQFNLAWELFKVGDPEHLAAFRCALELAPELRYQFQEQEELATLRLDAGIAKLLSDS